LAEARVAPQRRPLRIDPQQRRRDGSGHRDQPGENADGRVRFTHLCLDGGELLERNDRYLREFVEALRICPYARQCRETGKLHRRVLSSADDAPPAMREIEALPKDGVEVALLIFPSAPFGSEQSARDFESLCA
jgi:hypothetical protein